MNRNSTRVTAIVGTSMALVIAGTAAVSAAGPRGDERGPGQVGFGGDGIAAHQRGAMMPGPRGMGGMVGFDADVERVETTIQSADGVTSQRVEQGVAESADEAGLSFLLGSGEAVSVVIDEDTQFVAFEEQEVSGARGWSRTRMAPTEVEVADIAAGSEIVVWSDSEDGSDFVATRVVIQPADDSDAADDAVDTETEADTTEAAATDA